VRFGCEKIEDGISWAVPQGMKKSFLDAGEKLIDRTDEQLTGLLAKVPAPIVRATHTLEFVIQQPQQAGTHVKAKVGAIKQQVASLPGAFAQKTLTRFEAGVGCVRSLSANEVKSVIHVDLIAYASEVIENAHHTAQAHYDKVQELLASSCSSGCAVLFRIGQCASEAKEKGKQVAREIAQALPRLLMAPFAVASFLFSGDLVKHLRGVPASGGSNERVNLPKFLVDFKSKVWGCPSPENPNGTGPDSDGEKPEETDEGDD